jgi:hypothetical protein
MEEQKVSRQVRRAEERKIIRSHLSKEDRRRLARMPEEKRRALKKLILDQARNNATKNKSTRT